MKETVMASSRKAALLARLGRTANAVAVTLYRRSGGKVGGTAKGVPVLLLTVPGRRTGNPHTVPVAYIEHDGGYVVTGSAGGGKAEPQWFRNLRATDGVGLELGRSAVEADVVVAHGATRGRLWQDVVLQRAPFFAKYQTKAGRVIPVATVRPRHVVPSS